MAEPEADLIAWLASVNNALVVYAKDFASVGYSNFELVRDMDHEERDDILEALDKAGIMKVRNLGRSRRGGRAPVCTRACFVAATDNLPITLAMYRTLIAPGPPLHDW